MFSSTNIANITKPVFKAETQPQHLTNVFSYLFIDLFILDLFILDILTLSV
jgi:hypothetical protein